MKSLTVREILVALFAGLAFACYGCLVSIQPTFYPTEAERKGARPSQYGLVFGITSLSAVIFAPIFAHFGNVVGAKLIVNVCGVTQGAVGILFGLLEYVDLTWLFLASSYLLRFVEGICLAACNGSLLAILMNMFPSKAASATAWTEMFMGLGYMIGPVMGAGLYFHGGFMLPFVVVGIITLIAAVALIILLPSNDKVETDCPELQIIELDKIHLSEEELNKTNRLKVFDVLKSFPLAFPYVNNFVAYLGNGMLESMLEPHMKYSAAAAGQFDVAFAFVNLGVFYLLGTIIAGYMCDRMKSPEQLSLIGNILLMTAFLIVGPVPILPFKPSVAVIELATALTGMGIAAMVISTFARVMAVAAELGYDFTMETNLTISGWWASSFHLGNFIGPTIAGFLVESIGFRATSFVYLLFFATMAIIDLGFVVKKVLEKNHVAYQALN